MKRTARETKRKGYWMVMKDGVYIDTVTAEGASYAISKVMQIGVKSLA